MRRSLILFALPVLLFGCSTRVEWENRVSADGVPASISNIRFGGAAWEENVAYEGVSSQKEVDADYGQVMFLYRAEAAGAWHEWTTPEYVNLESGRRNYRILAPR